MNPVFLLGIFSAFTIYGWWLSIPLTTVNPYAPLPARIAGAVQLTAFANTAVSTFRNALWADQCPANSTCDSSNNDTLNLADSLEAVIRKWEPKFEKHLVEQCENSYHPVTIRLPIPKSQSTLTATALEEYNRTDPRHEENRNNSTGYKILAILIPMACAFLPCSLATKFYHLRKNLNPISDCPSGTEADIIVPSSRLGSLVTKTDETLSNISAATKENRNAAFPDPLEKLDSLKDAVHNLEKHQLLCESQYERLSSGLLSCQEQLTELKTDISSVNDQLSNQKQTIDRHVAGRQLEIKCTKSHMRNQADKASCIEGELHVIKENIFQLGVAVEKLRFNPVEGKGRTDIVDISPVGDTPQGGLGSAVLDKPQLVKDGETKSILPDDINSMSSIKPSGKITQEIGPSIPGKEYNDDMNLLDYAHPDFSGLDSERKGTLANSPSSSIPKIHDGLPIIVNQPESEEVTECQDARISLGEDEGKEDEEEGEEGEELNAIDAYDDGTIGREENVVKLGSDLGPMILSTVSGDVVGEGISALVILAYEKPGLDEAASEVPGEVDYSHSSSWSSSLSMPKGSPAVMGEEEMDLTKIESLADSTCGDGLSTLDGKGD